MINYIYIKVIIEFFYKNNIISEYNRIAFYNLKFIIKLIYLLSSLIKYF